MDIYSSYVNIHSDISYTTKVSRPSNYLEKTLFKIAVSTMECVRAHIDFVFVCTPENGKRSSGVAMRAKSYGIPNTRIYYVIIGQYA